MAGRNSYDRSVERGIKQRHWDTCPSRHGKRCNCRPRAYIASASVNGKRVYSTTLRDLDAARAWRGRALAGDVDVPSTGDDRETLRETWRRWGNAAAAGTALSNRRRAYAETTLADYHHAMQHHVLPALGDTPTEKLEDRHAQAMIDALASDGISPTRQASAATALRTVMRWASKRGRATPLGPLELPRVPSRTPTVLGPEAVAGRLALVAPSAARRAAAIAVYAGLRAMEIMALDVADVDTEGLIIRVRDGKTDAAERLVPIVRPLLPYLVERPRSGALFAADRLPRSAYRTIAGHLSDAWADTAEEVTLHVLRHNFVSWMFAAGVPYPAAQKISGHKTPLVPGVTLGVYGHAVEDHVDDARQRLDQWIAGQSKVA